MDQQTTPNNEPDIIICEDIPDTISITSSPIKQKNNKTKRKHKRKINYCANMDNLLITRKVKRKKKKFKCFINMKTVCEERSEIVRSAYNVCKKEAYYHRIVPSCLRKMCSGEGITSCCRSTISKQCNEYRNPKVGSLSPVSSVALTDPFAYNNISYEDISNDSFMIDSEELETLIKRTKQREKQYQFYPTRNTSTPLPNIDDIPTPSPYSIDTDKKSIHSDTTLVLRPLSGEAYSPNTSSDAINIDLNNIDDAFDNMIAIDNPYYRMNELKNVEYIPVEKTDLRKNMAYSPYITTNDDDNVPYSPTYTPDSLEINYDRTINRDYTSGLVKTEILDSTMKFANMHSDENEPNQAIMTPKMINNLNNSETNIIDRVNSRSVNRYSPSSPTKSPDHDFPMNRQTNKAYFPPISEIKQELVDETTTEKNNTYSQDSILTANIIKNSSPTKSPDHDFPMNRQTNKAYFPPISEIKQELVDESTTEKNNTYSQDSVLTTNIIKRETENYEDLSNYRVTDHNMNDTINFKIEKLKNEKEPTARLTKL